MRVNKVILVALTLLLAFVATASEAITKPDHHFSNVSGLRAAYQLKALNFVKKVSLVHSKLAIDAKKPNPAVYASNDPALTHPAPAAVIGYRLTRVRGLQPSVHHIASYPYDKVVITDTAKYQYEPMGSPMLYNFTFSVDMSLISCTIAVHPCSIALFVNGYQVTSQSFLPKRPFRNQDGVRQRVRPTNEGTRSPSTSRLSVIPLTSPPCSLMPGAFRGNCAYHPTYSCGADVEQLQITYFGVTYYSQPVQLNLIDTYGCHKRSPPCQCVHDPVDPITGAMSWKHTDFSLSGPFGLEFKRYYNSQSISTAGALGPNWHSTYSDYLDLSNYSLQNSEFKQVVYFNDEGAPDYFVLAGPTRSLPNTFYEDTSGDRITINNPGASQTYTVTTWHGTAYNFNGSGVLQSISDRHGNSQALTYTSGKLTSVSDVLGRSISFSYDSQNPSLFHSVTSYTSINNPSGVKVSFGYTSNGGVTNLTSAIEPDGQSQGKSWQYGYDTNGLLNTITDASGTYRQNDVYLLTNNQTGDANFFQVVSQTSSNPNIGPKQDELDFTYSVTTTGGPYPVSTTVVDGDGNSTVFYADSATFRMDQVMGPLCDCHGAPGMVSVDDEFGRLKESYSTGNNPGVVYYGYGEDSCFVNTPNGPCVQIVYPEPAVTQIVRQSSVGCVQTVCPTMPPTTVGYGALDSTIQDLPTSISYPSVAVTVPGASPNPIQSPTTETLTYDAGGKAELLSDSTSGLTSNSSGSLVVQTNTINSTFDALARIKTITGPLTGQAETINYWPDNTTDLATRGQLKSLQYAVTPTQNGNNKLLWTFAPASLAAPYNNYDVYGNPGGVQNPSGDFFGATYSVGGQIASEVVFATINSTLNPTHSYAYDFADRVTRITKPLGNYTTYAYDVIGRMNSVTRQTASNLSEDQLALAYSNMSRQTSEQASYCSSSCGTSPVWIEAQMESLTYDGLDNVKELVHPIPATSPASFGLAVSGTAQDEGFGELDATMDELHPSPIPNVGPFQKFGYDGYQRLSTANGIFGMRDTVTSAYNTSDERTSAGTGINQNGDNYLYAYDDFGRVIAWTSTDVGGVNRYSYDNGSDRISMIDPLLNSTSYTYDSVNRLLTQTATKAGNTDSTTFSYDNSTGCSHCIGRLTRMTDPTGSTDYTYEIRGYQVTAKKTINSTSYTTSFAYDANGNQITVTYPSGRIVNYSYDFADRPFSAATSSTTYVSGAAYEPFGPIESITYGNNTQRLITYDLRYQLQENKLIPTGNPNAPIVDFGYQEDLDGNISAISDALHPPVPPAILGPYDRAFKYDNANDNRILEADAGQSLWGSPGPGVCVGQFCYGSDSVINSYQLGTQPTTTFTYGTTAQMTSYQDGTNPAVSVTYDADGNEAVVGAATYNYSPRNLLASGDGLTYGYDGFGTRTTTSKSGIGSRFTFYTPDMHLLEETNVTTLTPSAAYDYIWFSDIPVAQEDISSGNTHWTMSDHLGTPIVQTSSTGAIYWQADYAPGGEIFNNTLRVGSAIHQPLRLPGQEAEQFGTANSPNGDTGRYYNVNRWYRPHLYRYTQTDPIGIAGGTNPYEYAANNPLGITDPSGAILIIPRDDIWSWLAAEQYLSQDPTTAANIATIENSMWAYTLQTPMDSNSPAGSEYDMFDQYGGKIYWDPNLAHVVTGCQTQSPSLSLAHEFGHAAEFENKPFEFWWGQSTPTKSISKNGIQILLILGGSEEENRNTNGPERAAATTLGEGIRRLYNQSAFFRVGGPLDRGPIPAGLRCKCASWH